MTRQTPETPGRTKVTIPALRSKYKKAIPLSMLTAYDYPTAAAADRAGVDMILVGDSLAMVVLGYENTLAVTMDEMIHHCKAVRRGASHPLLIGDMPFMSYQADINEAVHNAGRFLQEAGMDAVKLEGGRERVNAVRAIIDAGIPVMGHLGLTPQRVHQLGGFRAQGKNAESAVRIFEDALFLQEAGCFGLVLEAVPEQLAQTITERLDIFTIGIGAGPKCDGQVLVSHDVLGLYDRFTPRFAKRYADLYHEMEKAFQTYIQDVENSRFPSKEHTQKMPEEEWQHFLRLQDSK
jgi:3-methyl-2-oxobutanoate hydroxymethyltransferase